MNNKEIKEANHLIAKFMEWHYQPDVTKRYCRWYHNGLVWIKVLLFHSSWDWLMPVLQKIDELDFEIPEDSNLIGDITHGLVSLDIEMTYEAVVEFIKFYNHENRIGIPENP